jgi:ribosome-associated translation inhibitor RaiA
MADLAFLRAVLILGDPARSKMKPSPGGTLSGGHRIVTIPVQITFRHMESSPAVETRVRELANHLGVFSDRITSCRVVVDSPHRHQHQGKVFNVKVQLALPGDDVVVDMERPQRDGHEDVYVVIRDAFDAARRQLQARMASLRGDEKRRDIPS